MVEQKCLARSLRSEMDSTVYRFGTDAHSDVQAEMNLIKI